MLTMVDPRFVAVRAIVRLGAYSERSMQTSTELVVRSGPLVDGFKRYDAVGGESREMDRRSVVIRIALALGLFSACQMPERAPVETTTTRDSAGVKIVESTVPAWSRSAAWSLTDTPRQIIGSVAGEIGSQLFRVQDAHLFANGRIAIANAGTFEVRFYDPAGQLIASAGGEGEGPGEFQLLSRIDAVGDSIFAYDRGLGRMSVVSGGGEFTRSFGLPFLDDHPPARPLGVFDDRSILADSPYDFGPESTIGFQRLRELMVRIDPDDGTIVDRVGDFPGNEFYLAEVNGQLGSQAVPFARQSVTAVFGNAFFFGSADAFVVDRHASDGRLLASFRIVRPARPAGEAELDRFIANLAENAPNEEVASRLEAHYRQMPLPDSMPAYSRLLVDAVGNLWVQEYSGVMFSASTWSVFDDDGRWLGTVDMPEGFTAYQIGDDFVLGRLEDELDIEFVVVFGLEKP